MTGRLFVQGSPTDCGTSGSDRGTSKSRPWYTGAVDPLRVGHGTLGLFSH
jgi:hypothetical protein